MNCQIAPRKPLIILSLLVTLLIHHAPAPGYAQGGVIVRIQDGAGSHCIDPSRERVWLMLRRLITHRAKQWFTKDDSVAILINADVATDPPLGKRISYPLLSKATFAKYPTGQLSVPVEYSVVQNLHLSQEGHTIIGLSVELTLLNLRKRNGWGNALEALSEITDKLPISGSPVAQAAGYLLEFTNSSVNKDLEDQELADKARSATLALNFDPTGTCLDNGEGGFEKTGTLAVIQSTGIEGAGLIPVDRTNEYCWRAELQPAFVLKAAPKHGNVGVPCRDSEYSPVTNDYVGFYLNARPVGDLRSHLRSEREDDVYMIEAYDRCKAHGITSRDECFP